MIERGYNPLFGEGKKNEDIISDLPYYKKVTAIPFFIVQMIITVLKFALYITRLYDN